LAQPITLRRSGAVEEGAVVGVGPLGGPGGDGEALLHGLKVRSQIAQIKVVALSPVVQHPLGGAEAGGPVDGGGAAHGAALEHQDGEVVRALEAAALVHQGQGLPLPQGEVAPRLVAARLDHHHIEPGLHEALGQHSAAGPRAHDGHIADLVDVLAQLAPVDGPALHPSLPGGGGA
jgi:hypothetical protein